MVKARTTIICSVGRQPFGIVSTYFVAVLAQFPSTMLSHSAETDKSLQLQFQLQNHVFVKGHFLGDISKSFSSPKHFHTTRTNISVLKQVYPRPASQRNPPFYCS